MFVMFSKPSFLIVLLLLALPYRGNAEEIGALPPPPLPAASDGINAGVLINSFNAAEYRSLIIPEMYPQIRSRQLESDAVSALRVSPQATVEDDSLSPETTASKKSAEDILSEAYSLYANHKLFSAEVNLIFLKDGRLHRELTGEFIRAYPKLLNPEDKSIQYFRELLRFKNPSFLSGFNLLTFRFHSEEEDMLWMSSPAIKKVIQLTGSNRADPVLGSAVSLDDFFAWSGKPESVEAVLDKEITALVPFSSLYVESLNPDSGDCFIYETGKSLHNRNKLLWNYQTQRFPDALPWVPSSAVFVPRKLVRLELIAKDPFSIYGRQILYIDSTTSVVFYKYVYDRSGYRLKSVYHFPLQLSYKSGAESFIFTDYLVANNDKSGQASIVNFDKIKFCRAFNQEIALKDFDPANLIQPASAAKEEKKN